MHQQVERNLYSNPLPGRAAAAALRDFFGPKEPVNFNERTDKPMRRDKPDMVLVGEEKGWQLWQVGSTTVGNISIEFVRKKINHVTLTPFRLVRKPCRSGPT